MWLGSLFWFVERRVLQKRGNLNNRTFSRWCLPADDPRETRERPAKNIREGAGGDNLKNRTVLGAECVCSYRTYVRYGNSSVKNYPKRQNSALGNLKSKKVSNFYVM